MWLRAGRELRQAAAWPDDDAPSIPAVPVAPEGALSVPGETAVEVRDRGELLGALSVRMPAADPMNPTKEKLVRDLAAQAGLVLRNVRLVEDLRASRQRLVAAQDEERRRLERNIHDGAQQQLVALAVKARLARQLTERDPAKTAEMLIQIEAETQTALEDLRDLARGIYPPLLADRGLVAALEAQSQEGCRIRRAWRRTPWAVTPSTWRPPSISAPSRRSRTSRSTPDADRTVIRSVAIERQPFVRGRRRRPRLRPGRRGHRLRSPGHGRQARSRGRLSRDPFGTRPRHHGGGPCAGHRCLISEGNDRGDGIRPTHRTHLEGVLAFRLVGWIFGVLTIGYSLFLVVLSIVSERPLEHDPPFPLPRRPRRRGTDRRVLDRPRDATGLDVCLPRPRRPGDRVDRSAG